MYYPQKCYHSLPKKCEELLQLQHLIVLVIAGSLFPSYCLVTILYAVKILKFGTPQTIAIIVLKIEKFDVTLH